MRRHYIVFRIRCFCAPPNFRAPRCTHGPYHEVSTKTIDEDGTVGLVSHTYTGTSRRRRFLSESNLISHCPQSIWYQVHLEDMGVRILLDSEGRLLSTNQVFLVWGM